jgi:hypothetical protein
VESISKNLGISTDLLLHAQSGIVEQKNEYIVVRTPDAPEYYFGNMLILRERPRESDLVRIESAFADQVGGPPVIKHRTFMWPDTELQFMGLEAYVEAGYSSTHNCVLVAEQSDLRLAVTKPVVHVRKYRDQADWDSWTAMHLLDNSAPDSDGTYKRYLSHQQTAYKKLISLGFGDWWGAYLDEEQVGSVGLFFFRGIGRFQSVITVERYRNQKICKTLLQEVAVRAFSRAQKLVIVADESYYAGAIYQSMGFRRHQWMGTLCREPCTWMV